MNHSDDDDPVAALLSRIRPAAPREDLMQRLLAARPSAAASPVVKPKVIRFPSRLAAAAAILTIAGAAVWFSLPRDPQEVAVTPPPAPKTEITAVRYLAPLESSQELLNVRDLGIARDAESRPVRLMHATWLDKSTYGPTDGSAPVRESRMREEILPVVLTTY
jgi:hypothetical protein